MKRKFWDKPIPFLYAVIAAFLLLGVLFALVKSIAYDRSFYEAEYLRYGQAEAIGMSDADLMRVTDKLLSHMAGESADMNVTAAVDGVEREIFNEQEKLHMKDVNALMRGFDALEIASFIAAALALAAFLFFCREERIRKLSKTLLYAAAALGVIFAGLGIWAALDFHSFWWGFHGLLFRNDLWLMDPRTCIMINMFPAEFFSDLVMKFLGRALPVLGLPLLAAVAGLIFTKKKR